MISPGELPHMESGKQGTAEDIGHAPALELQIAEHQTTEEVQFGTASDIAQATTQRIRLTSDIKIIDLYHFGWNIGTQYKKPGMEIAQFLKNVFAEKLYDTEVTTIVRKLRMTGACRIKIKSEI